MSMTNNHAAIAGAQLDYLNQEEDECEFAMAMADVLGALSSIDGSGYPVPQTIRRGAAKGYRAWLDDYAVDFGWAPSDYRWARDVTFGPTYTDQLGRWFALLSILHHLVNPTPHSFEAAVECSAWLSSLQV